MWSSLPPDRTCRNRIFLTLGDVHLQSDTQLRNLFGQKLDIDRIGVAAGMKEPRGGESRDRSEQTQPRGHQDAGNETAFECDRKVIAVPHGGNGTKRPPE